MLEKSSSEAAFSYLVGPNFIVNFLDPNLASANVPADGAKILHPGQGQFAQVAMFNTRTEKKEE